MAPRHVGSIVTTLIGALAACAPDRPDPYAWEPRPQPLSFVDCVAVLGALPGTMVQTPLSEVPRSGLDRDKTIAMLDDTELVRLCDFDVCLRVNGYLRKCYGYTNNLDDTRYRREAVPLVAKGMYTCSPNVNPPQDNNAERAWGTRQDCVDIYRGYFGRCHVGAWEDCIRESAVRVLASEYRPSCEQTKRECPIQ